ncbi:MAG: hypothetical protein HY742_10865 [Deltaproteobacteria bacterium]|nr:hypothetical protein [Deltaproteobacteria bacterium]
MHRKPLGYRPIDPRITTIFMDSCAFDPKYSPEDQAALTLFNLSEKDELILNIAHSTQKEIEHPNTPAWVKLEANKLIYTIKTSLTADEVNCKGKIFRILAGNGKPENMVKDAEHIFEADKYSSYFVTTDERILKKKEELKVVVSLHILKPSELLEILDSYKNS